MAGAWARSGSCRDKRTVAARESVQPAARFQYTRRSTRNLSLNVVSAPKDLLTPLGAANTDAAPLRESEQEDTETRAHSTGILPVQELERLVRVTREVYGMEPIQDDQFQPASLDLR